MRSYRTLLLKYPLERLPPEAVAQLLKVQEEFRRWAEEWARSGGKAPAPEQRPLKYFAERFIHAAGVLEWLREHVIKRGSASSTPTSPSWSWGLTNRLEPQMRLSQPVAVELKNVRG